MPDYGKGKAYKVLHYIDKDVFVGYTCDTLTNRLCKHKSEIKRDTRKDHALIVKMNDFGYDSFYTELIENYPCSNTNELKAHTGHFIREFGTLNKQQYKTGTIEENTKARHKDNYDKQKAVKVTCECGRSVARSCMAAHIKSDLHKDAMGITLDQVECECGLMLSSDSMENHLKSKNHAERMVFKNNGDFHMLVPDSERVNCNCGITLFKRCMGGHKISHPFHLSVYGCVWRN